MNALDNARGSCIEISRHCCDGQARETGDEWKEGTGESAIRERAIRVVGQAEESEREFVALAAENESVKETSTLNGRARPGCAYTYPSCRRGQACT